MTLALEELQQQFQDAIADLWWMSETDATFEIIVWPQAFQQGFSIRELMALRALDLERPTQEMPIDQFFAPAVRPQDWHGDLEKEEVKRFQQLQTLISEHLSEVRVCRIGETQLDLVIVGKTEENDWIALVTQAVET